MPTITVIIPVYNVENYLEKCVKSVEAQTYDNCEIILVDDGSTDSSGELCDRLAEKNPAIRVIHQENRGLGGARNSGLEVCDTKYVFFLDSDDYLSPSALESCFTVAEKNRCDLVFFDLISVNEQGEQGVTYSLQAPQDQLLGREDIVKIFKNPSACDKFYKTSLFKDNGIRFPEKVWYEDLRTIPKLIPFIKTAVKLGGKPLYYYLQRTCSIMHTPDYTRIVRERKEAVADLLDYYKSKNLYDQYTEELNFAAIYHALILPCLEMYRIKGRHDKYIDELLKNVKMVVDDPSKNGYLCLLRKNEKRVFRLILKKRYRTIGWLTGINHLLKGVQK